MSKSTKQSKRSTLPTIRGSVVVGIAAALRASVSKTSALRVRVVAYKAEYGKNAVKLLGQLRKAVRAELGLGKNQEQERKWNTFRVLLDRVCREAGVASARKAAARKPRTFAQKFSAFLSNATPTQRNWAVKNISKCVKQVAANSK